MTIDAIFIMVAIPITTPPATRFGYGLSGAEGQRLSRCPWTTISDNDNNKKKG